MLKETIKLTLELAFFVLISTPLAIMLYLVATIISHLKTPLQWLKKQQ